MQINQKIKGIVSSVFNVLSGKKGLDAAAAGYATIFCTGLTVISVVAGAPAVVAVGLACATGEAIVSHEFVKRHDNLKV